MLGVDDLLFLLGTSQNPLEEPSDCSSEPSVLAKFAASRLQGLREALDPES